METVTEQPIKKIEFSRCPPEDSGYEIALGRKKLLAQQTAFRIIIKKSFTQLIIESPKPKNRKVSKINDHSRESKAFSKSMNSSNSGIFFSEAYWIIPSMCLMFSPMNLPFIKPV